MKKFLRFIVILLLIIIVGVVVLGLIAPKDISTERSVTINAPKAVVEDVMLQYKNYYIWNPFRDHDTNMTVSIIGPERQAGTKYSWKGNKNVGSGEMTTKSYKDGELQYDLHFMEPMENTATGFWKVEDAGNGQSKATWSFNTHIGFPWNGLMMIMGGMDKEFDKGLNRLKAYSEAHAKDMPAADAGTFEIKDIQFPGHNYVTIRKTQNIQDMRGMQDFFTNSYTALGKAAGPKINGPASGLFYTWDEKAMTTDMAAAFPVSEDIKGMTMSNVPASRGYQIVYQGGYHGSGKAHEAMMKHMGAKGEQQSMAIEEYIKGPGDTQDSTQWVTNIIYLVK